MLLASVLTPEVPSVPKAGGNGWLDPPANRHRNILQQRGGKLLLLLKGTGMFRSITQVNLCVATVDRHMNIIQTNRDNTQVNPLFLALSMGKAELQFESRRSKISHLKYHSECCLKEIWILTFCCSLKSPTHFLGVLRHSWKRAPCLPLGRRFHMTRSTNIQRHTTYNHKLTRYKHRHTMITYAQCMTTDRVQSFTGKVHDHRQGHEHSLAHNAWPQIRAQTFTHNAWSQGHKHSQTYNLWSQIRAKTFTGLQCMIRDKGTNYHRHTMHDHRQRRKHSDT